MEEYLRYLTEEYGVGATTIYDLKKQKDKLLKFYSDSENQELMKNRKILQRTKNDLDHVDWMDSTTMK